MTRRKALREKDSRRVRRGVTYPATGAARTAQCARRSTSKRFLKREMEQEMTSGERLREEQTNPFKWFICVQCGFEYDEAKGWPEDGIAPGTRWDDIPEDWSCPDCGAAKTDFEMVEVARP